MVRPIPGVEGILSVVGLNFIDYVASSNQAFFVIRLKPYEVRTDPAQSAGAIIARLRPQMAAIKGAVAFPFNLPPILGLGSTGGFQYALEALQGQSPTDVAATLRGLIVAANGQPELAGVFSTYAADTPQIYLDIDRDKAQVLGRQDQRYLQCPTVDARELLRQRLQRVRPHMAGQHPGARQRFATMSTTSTGSMCATPRAAWSRSGPWPKRSSCKGRRRWSVTTDIRGAIVNGAPKPGYSSGQALAAMERISASTLPAGYSYEWTGTALQEKAASGRTGIVLGFAVLFAYLFLVALYESWNIPVPALLSVSVAVLGASSRSRGRTELRCLRADRARGADRARREERHSDRCVCGGAAQPRARTSNVRARSGRPAVPPGDDDQFRVHLRTIAPGLCEGRRGVDAPCGRHAGVRRHDRCLGIRDFHHSAALHHRGTPAPTDADKAGPVSPLQLECDPSCSALYRPRSCRIFPSSRSNSIGLVSNSSHPAAIAFSRSPASACADSAMIGMSRVARIALQPPCRFPAVDHRHFEVHQDDVRPSRRRPSRSPSRRPPRPEPRNRPAARAAS